MNTKKPGVNFSLISLRALLEGCSFYFQEKSCRVSFEKPDCRRGEAPESFKKELRNYFEGKGEDFKQGAVFFGRHGF